MAKKIMKKQIEVDLEKIKSGIDHLIKERDPLQKWLPVLNELKPKFQDALSAGISVSKIRETLSHGGLKVSQKVLREFLEDK